MDRFFAHRTGKEEKTTALVTFLTTFDRFQERVNVRPTVQGGREGGGRAWGQTGARRAGKSKQRGWGSPRGVDGGRGGPRGRERRAYQLPPKEHRRPTKVKIGRAKGGRERARKTTHRTPSGQPHRARKQKQIKRLATGSPTNLGTHTRDEAPCTQD